ncbi:MAG: YraN family protein [Planctomycetota bacterium]
MERAILGRLGELWVACCLEDRGYRVVGRNVRQGREEIDIVLRGPRELLLVEVKTRQSERVASPETAVVWRKRQAFARAVRRLREAGRPLERTLAVRFVTASVVLAQPRALPKIRYSPLLPGPEEG